jgi:hypothetical protein
MVEGTIEDEGGGVIVLASEERVSGRSRFMWTAKCQTLGSAKRTSHGLQPDVGESRIVPWTWRAAARSPTESQADRFGDYKVRVTTFFFLRPADRLKP